MSNPTDKINAINSAVGVANQMPFTPKKAGNTSIVININTNDLENARMAETTPLDNAVNNPLAKILNPIKTMQHYRFCFQSPQGHRLDWSDE